MTAAADGGRAETLNWVVELAGEAAQVATTMLARGMTVDAKAGGELVTDIDRAVERLVRDALRARFPGHAILGEEYGREGATDAGTPLWAIDPIDGTNNLANGLPIWAISIALIENEDVTVGVLHAPLLREVYAAGLGLGATLNGEALPPLAPGGPVAWEDTYGLCTTSVRTRDFSRLEARLRVPGSAALDLAWVAAGRLRGTQSIGTDIYDVAAGLCLCRETGCETIWLDSGEAYSPREHAANGGRDNDTLLTAPPATLAFLRERLAPIPAS
mgnify:CR=1 FL=1|jgi:Archaeal fructose-1,6-bisphosphatase and related enzymes of inositol monophosphatase family